MTDLLKQLDNLLRTTAFTQGECLSCDKGFENHEYNCNTGPNCAAVKMWKQKNQIKDALTKAAARIRELETSNATAFAAGVEAAANVLDAYSEYDAPMCCDGRECGCQGATVHETIKHYIRALSPPTGMVMVPNNQQETKTMNDKMIKHMVDRFLGWNLPDDFSPDAGISFKAEFNEHTAYPMKHRPSGTNLLNAEQAEAMVRYLVDGLPSATSAKE